MSHRAYPREKHTPFFLRLIWCIYYQIRRILPAEILLKMLLNSCWALNALCSEQARLYESSTAEKSQIDVLRPKNVADAVAGLSISQRVCDFGGGLGEITQELVKRGCEVVYCDTSPIFRKNMYEKFSSFPNFKLAESKALIDGHEGVFDFVILSHVLEHIDNPTDFLRKLSQITERIHIEVPDLASDPLNYMRMKLDLPVYRDDDHVTEMSLEYLVKLIGNSGFIVESASSRDGCLIARANSLSYPT